MFSAKEEKKKSGKTKEERKQKKESKLPLQLSLLSCFCFRHCFRPNNVFSQRKGCFQPKKRKKSGKTKKKQKPQKYSTLFSTKQEGKKISNTSLISTWFIGKKQRISKKLKRESIYREWRRWNSPDFDRCNNKTVD